MFNFIVSNLPTIIVGGIILIVLGLILSKMIRDKKNHKNSCGCGCASCPSAEICHHS